MMNGHLDQLLGDAEFSVQKTDDNLILGNSEDISVRRESSELFISKFIE